MRTIEQSIQRFNEAVAGNQIGIEELDFLATFIDGLCATSGHVRSHTRGGMAIECQWIRGKLDGRT